MTATEPTTGTLEGAGQLRLFYRSHPATLAEGGGPRAAVLVVHGLAEHSGRYVHVLEALSARGFAGLGVDLRGHGHSAGARVYVDRFGDYLDDVDRAAAHARTLWPDVPLFILGHSMGGLVAAAHALDRPDGVAGYVLISPGVRSAIKVPAWKDALGKVMSKVWPGLAIPTGISPELVSRDPDVVRAYRDDPLVTDKATARWYTEFVATQRDVLARAPELKTPTMIVLGGADRLVDPAGGEELFARLGASDKERVSYPHARHEVLNEPEQGEALDAITRWLAARVA